MNERSPPEPRGDPHSGASAVQIKAPDIPRATYRLQFNGGFTFEDAARIVPFLARLGVSHVYASPLLKARPGSMHGYDVIDHSQLNPELGTREDFDRLIETLHAHGLGLILDVVPNHLGVWGGDNPWWLDVLENGPAARCALYFDIDWRPDRASMRERILAPVLGEPYGAALERGELRLTFDETAGEFSVRHHEHRLPIDPREYPRIFADAPIDESLLSGDDPNRADFESLLEAFGNLPARNDLRPESIEVRYRDKEAHKRRLVRLIERCAQVLEHIRRTLERVNGAPGEPSSFDALDALLDAQAYRVSYWRVASDEINYRRFFDVNDLAALRMDEREVFESTHRLIFELIGQGAVNGLRIDHSDGLYDPRNYFERLQRRCGATDEQPRPLYLVTEKIIAAHERLPESWLVHGTTGYDFAALSTAWLTAGEEEARTTRRYLQFTGAEERFEEIVYRSKRLVMRASLAAEVEVLASQLDRIAQLSRYTEDYTRAAMRQAIIQTIACFPVYRTYISPLGVGDEDRRIVHWAVGLARRRSAAAELSVFDFLRDVLLGEGADAPSERRRAMLEFAMKFQQVTAPVTAKGVEDTAFYRYSRLVCLNEVGADPRRFNISSAALHQENIERARNWPHAMLATSTHDTKRSEDARARIAVISELPELWALHLSRWNRLNRGKRRALAEGYAPDREDEYLFYQSLAGVWRAEDDPAQLAERLQAYMLKAAREAKRATSWISPDVDYEKGLCDFIAAAFERPERNAFLRDFAAFVQPIIYFGAVNSLAVTALKIAAPGVPDFYQGAERAILTLVDPDNRRPVDFEAAARYLEQIETLQRPPADLSGAKLYLTSKMLAFRKQYPELFARGSYHPLQIEGQGAEHLFSFARVYEDQCCILVIPRCTAKLMRGVMQPPLGTAVWGDTHIDIGEISPSVELLTNADVRFREIDGSRCLMASEVLAQFPVALAIKPLAG